MNPTNIYINQGQVILKNFFMCKTNFSQKLNYFEDQFLYWAPEQLAGSSSVDQKCDVWATGLVFYEMLFGSLPFPTMNN